MIIKVIVMSLIVFTVKILYNHLIKTFESWDE